MFYDENWKMLQRNYPLIAAKIEELRCETVNYDQYETEQKQLLDEVDRLKRQVKVLLELNGKQPIKKKA